jgi:hypothetical protein
MASTAMASLAQVEGGVLVQSQAADRVGRIQGAVSTSRYLGMSGGAALALLLSLALTWQRLVIILTISGLVLLGVSTLGPRSTLRTAAEATAQSPVTDIPD